MSDRAATLLSLARRTLEESFGGPPVDAAEAWPEERRAAFVTLTKHGRLRGCVGQIEARLPLYEAVRDATQAAAFNDNRFAPLEPSEVGEVRIELSLLSPIQWLEVHSEDEALAVIRPGVDGVLLRCGGRSGLFLPEMWKQLPDPKVFLALLKRKAGLPSDRWLPETQVGRFTAEVFDEPEDGRRT